MMEFLYFPDNKLEYIPAVATLILFMILAYIVFMMFRKKSKKDEEKMKSFEKQVMDHLEQEEKKNNKSK
ncbi:MULTISPECIES: hypothetical protein [Mammaliicoccus]|mgnify:FL=1|uniref:Uncharacterized protein n=1 Tax=Mammaliicoccus sciuri TaxID=1296 RepID=A0AAW5LK74_MAMSC|nr:MULTISPECIES: hypothetical protein [Mammaliicoccus]KTT82998.1 hypothetical protein NS202_07265 [Mammaliicoccus sciuri]MBA1395480.1 hypothetical protein [Mammaliicoccus sciuri]MBG9205987.1 hypothetical protein [Mammaliicoccus sciuri]MBG9209598.1 hypothetical protein [Mammaliicoccus sciuri]MCC2088402.1 hypothetical protein [Mammaliicoccus sciuri]